MGSVKAAEVAPAYGKPDGSCGEQANSCDFASPETAFEAGTRKDCAIPVAEKSGSTVHRNHGSDRQQ
jgi:hypothetical protein